MIFDLNDEPVTDNEYLQRVLAITILLVQAAGGKLVVPKHLMARLEAKRGKTFLDQQVDPTSGDLTLTVGERP